MSRYLTPSKIGVLGLVSLYTDAAVPSSAIIPILSFITSQVLPQSAAQCDSHLPPRTPSLALSVSEFEEVTKGFDSTFPGRSLHDKFLEKLWGISGLHALHAFFQDLSSLLLKSGNQVQRDVESEDQVTPKIPLSRTSPLGIFVRRAQLEFTRLQFDDTVKLWVAFMKFRAPSEANWRKKNPAAAAASFDSNFAELGLGPDADLVNVVYPDLQSEQDNGLELSTDDMERLLDFQLEKLQKFGNRVPDDMKDTFQTIMSNPSAVPSLAHFVKFFDAWRAGDYTASFESLHRYFDYTMHTRDKSFYQYALLHMAILQADFGCFSEAVAAMTETIATARENQDMSCLNFSLSWLNHLGKAYPKQMRRAGYAAATGSEKEGLAYLKMKAKEMKLPNLLSSTLLSETKMLLATGESIPQAFERLHQSSHLNVVYNIENVFGTQLLVQSAIYGRLGLNQMAESYCEVLLDCYQNCSPVEELLRSSCRRAYSAIQGGMYKQAMNILDSVQPLVHRNLRAYQYLACYSGLLKLKRSLRRQDLTAASHLLTQLLPPTPNPNTDPELIFQLTLLRIDYLQRTGSYEAAYNAIEDLGAQLEAEESDIYQRIHVMVLKALLFARVGKPQKGFTVAMRAANAAWQSRLLPALWEAWGAIANILGVLGEWEAQRRVLEGIIPQALGSGDVALCAQLYAWHADACMGLAGAAEDNPRLRASFVSKAEIYIDRAAKCYKQIEDIRGECDTMNKKSLIARLRGDAELAEDWARKYVSLYEGHFSKLSDDEDDTEEEDEAEVDD